MHRHPQELSPKLSVIVPLLNESETLSGLFAMLAQQEGVAFELLLCDGGSTDGSAEMARQLGDHAPFPSRVIRSDKGRGRQLNAGACAAGAEILLFLHADSAFSDPLALRSSVDTLTTAAVRRGDDRVAGRFALRFDVPAGNYGPGYYFYECKARLGRPEGIHGDQGFLLCRSFFEEIGPFAQNLPLLEDTRLAQAIRNAGEWLLLPAEIVTSARRFEAEGFFERQILNALIMNFAAIGWDEFLRAAPGLYQIQNRTRKLDLRPFWHTVRAMLRPLSWRQRWRLWYLTGCYVRSQAWQLAFAVDAYRSFRLGLAPGVGKTPCLNSIDRWYETMTDHLPFRIGVTLLVWGWFHLLDVCFRVQFRRRVNR